MYYMNAEVQLRVLEDRCNGCGLCVEACPIGAIALSGGVAVIDQGLCQACDVCVQVCPLEAIEVATPVTIDSTAIVLPRYGKTLPAKREPEEAPPIRVIVPVEPRVSLVRRAATTLGTAAIWLVPRVVDAVLDAVERRADRSGSPAVRSDPAAIEDVTRGARGLSGRRRRRRAGRGR